MTALELVSLLLPLLPFSQSETVTRDNSCLPLTPPLPAASRLTRPKGYSSVRSSLCPLWLSVVYLISSIILLSLLFFEP